MIQVVRRKGLGFNATSFGLRIFKCGRGMFLRELVALMRASEQVRPARQAGFQGMRILVASPAIQ
jgi:hypothetical protein